MLAVGTISPSKLSLRPWVYALACAILSLYGSAGAEEYWVRPEDSWISARLEVDVDEFDDLEFTDRDVQRNDLGLTLATGSTSEQNRRERVEWDEGEARLVLGVHPSLWRKRPLEVFLGVGAAEVGSRFSLEKVDHSGPEVLAGLRASLFQLRSGWELLAEGRYAFGKTEATRVDAAGSAATSEKIRYRWEKTIGSLWLFVPGWGGESSLGRLHVRPRLGGQYRSISVEERYRAVGSSGSTRIDFELETASSERLRALVGLDLAWEDAEPQLALEVSAGENVLGGLVTLRVNF